MRRNVFRGGLAAGAVFICAVAGLAFGQPWSGSGTEVNPYQIWTAEDMQAIGADSNYWDAQFRLEAHIDLGGYTGESFNIIGSTTVPFAGVFDGNSHKIFNFTYKSANKDYVGLFGYVDDANAVIRRLEIVEPNVDAGWGNNVGVLVGELRSGSARNCQVSGGSVAGDYCVGGLVGRTSGAELLECSTATAVSAYSSSIGGIGGAIADGLTSDCYAVGSVTGSDKVGGLIGLFSSGGLIRNCFSAGRVSSPGSKGGLVGYHWDSGTYYYKCFWDSTVNPDMNGIGNRTDANVVGQTTTNMYLMSTFTNAGWDFVGETANGTDDIWKINDGNDYPKLSYQALRYGGGSGDANDPYQIWSPSDMQAIGAIPNDWDKNFLLMRDIDLAAYTGTSFNIIGNSNEPFTGVFDGSEHTISNLRYDSNDTNNIGLFAVVGAGGQIGQVYVTDVDISSGLGYFVGGLVGVNYGVISGCHVEGDIVGGGGWTIGGLAGHNFGEITDCYFTGSIYGSTGEEIGGLVGDNYGGTITNCYALGIVSADMNSGTEEIGGLVGENGGIGGTISSSWADCIVSGNFHIGGLVGHNYDVISNCYARGSVDGNCVGGLAGASYWGSIVNCYSTGSVVGNLCAGGLIGDNDDSTVTNCFWDVNSSGEPNSDGGTGKTTVQMQTRSTFTDAGWDFVGEIVNGPNDIWKICDDTNYPKLSWQEQVGDFACPDGVNLIDFSVLGAAWYSEPNDYNWDPNCDISIPNDNIIDERDLVVFTSNWLVGI